MNSPDSLAEAHQALDRLLLERDFIVPTRPLVVDSDVLLRNIVRDAGGSNPPTKLLVQARLTTLRIYIAPHQLDEIREHLPRVAIARAVDPQRAMNVFMRDYVPVLWAADVRSAVWQGTGSLTTDPDDEPIARLGVLLGLRIVTANTRHFGDLAIEDEWFAVVSAYASVGLFDGVNAGGIFTARVSGGGAAAAARAARAGYNYLTEHPRATWVAYGVLGAMLVLALIVFSDPKRRDAIELFARRAMPVVKEGASRATRGYAGLAAAAFHAEGVVLSSKLAVAERSLDQRLAELLASSQFPVPTARLVEGLSPAAARLIRAALHQNPAFIEHDGGRWTFGDRLTQSLTAAP